ncbi:MAG: HNH endonuclease signature motif containing protein [Candidatus Sulfotelmatobacter sp.]
MPQDVAAHELRLIWVALMKLCGRGCARAIPDDAKCCDECAAERGISTNSVKTHTTGYTAELDKLRKSPLWQRIRAVIARRDPMCMRCHVAVTEIVDHVVPAAVAVMQARASGKYTFSPNAGYFFKSNLQGLCRSCHWTKTNEDKMHVGEWPDVVAKEQAQPKKVWSF